MTKLHEMKLHEVLTPDIPKENVSIMRVPGGWIYRFFEPESSCGGSGEWSANYRPTAVFVPLSHDCGVI